MPDRRLAQDSLRARARTGLTALAHPVAIKGLVATIAGVAVLVMPGVSTLAAGVVVCLAVATSGIAELWFALTGRRRLARARNRAVAIARGVSTLALAIALGTITVFVEDGAGIELALVIMAAGVYVVVRGLIVIVAALVRRHVTHRGLRVTGGITAVAVGTLGVIAPRTVSSTAIAATAVAAVVFGLVLITWSLRRVEGEIVTDVDPATAPVTAVLWDSIRTADVGVERRTELAESLYFESPERLSKRAAWWVMLVLSVAIATYAVLADSTAVVIGAMLVAPLMAPILGLAGAIVNGWRRRAVDSALHVVLGASVAVGLAYALAAWAPVAIAFDTNSQITSRVNPTLLDMLIALAAGAAGAFATVDRRVASGIAGVAIAVALVPPLAVVGICLGGGRADDAVGALVLFLTNFVAIVLAACVVFVLSGFAHPSVLARRAPGILTTVVPFVALAAVILVPLIFTSQGLLATAQTQARAQSVVDDWLGEDSAIAVQSITVEDAEVTVALIGEGDPPAIEDLQQALVDELFLPLAVTVQMTPIEVTSVPAASVTPHWRRD
ncbi:DUF389 domain-containing protein [Demequina sp. NBRC 110057]|uniref:DUF389 domain-containing protein n=1 Tax=Demequina sp. NBRC 110057 TaxID=1570346 RepID=UPI000A058346|nr:DUF389 domain-containing protein [Demequina sp. NBRC 110057]